jgi:hypothetical protein
MHSVICTQHGMIGASLETEQGLGLLVEKDAIYYPMLVNRLAACVLNPALDFEVCGVGQAVAKVQPARRNIGIQEEQRCAFPDLGGLSNQRQPVVNATAVGGWRKTQARQHLTIHTGGKITQSCIGLGSNRSTCCELTEEAHARTGSVAAQKIASAFPPLQLQDPDRSSQSRSLELRRVGLQPAPVVQYRGSWPLHAEYLLQHTTISYGYGRVAAGLLKELASFWSPTTGVPPELRETHKAQKRESPRFVEDFQESSVSVQPWIAAAISASY